MSSTDTDRRNGQTPSHQILSRRAELATGPAIGKLMAQALAHPDLISLAAGFVDNATLPTQATERCFEEISKSPSSLKRALQYDATAGDLELRKLIAEWSYKDFSGATPCPERLLLTAGSNQFLHLITEAIINPGDIVLVAAPTYFVYLGTLRGVDARVIGIPADEDGISTEALREKLEELAASGHASRVKAIYSVTEFDNPAGSTLSAKRRQELVELAAKWRAEHGPVVVFSDNAYQLLRYQGDSIAPVSTFHEEADDFVIELGTFSKSFSPGIRVGWGVVPEWLVPTLLDMKSNLDFGSPHFSQVLMTEVISSGALDQHLPVIRAGYQVKLTAMLDALDRHFGSHEEVHWRTPNGGLYVWLTFPEHVETSETGEFWNACLEQGVLYVPGHHCFPAEMADTKTTTRNKIRLSFGVQDAQSIRAGIEKLALAYEQIHAASTEAAVAQ